MVFKLVRTDTEEPCKILLPSGRHLIGRGKLLECDDKRVSRKHGEIEVNEDAISIKALHQNPCFYVTKNSEETEILKQNCVISLTNGDKFGLLPSSYWYEILHCTGVDLEEPPNITCDDDQQNNDINSERTQYIDSNSERTKDSPVNQTIPVANTTTNAMDDRDDEELLSLDMNESVTNVRGSQSPSLIQAGSPTMLQRMSPSLTPAEITEPVTENNAAVNPPEQQNDSTTESYPLDEPTPTVEDPARTKRSHSVEDSKEDIKKVKVEPVDVKQEADADATPGPSGDQGPSGSGNADDNSTGNTNNMPGSPVKPPAPGRERCMYGANCYRKNPAHKAQFSHPVDADWGAGERGMCPWGAACCKRDPRHWQQNEHPPGTQPPPPHNRPATARKKRTKPRANSEDSEDDLLSTSLIVTGKRARNTVRVQSWSGSESEDEDPYKTDESDEWIPGSETQSQSQNTQDLDD